MRIRRSSRQGCVVLTLVGRLDLAAAPQVQRAILKQLVEQPPAIICDLSGVEGIDPLCAGVFTSMAASCAWLARARPWCCAASSRRWPTPSSELGVARSLSMYPSLDEALANARARPQRLRARLTLGPVLTAAAAGRQFVAEVCGQWGLQALAEPAALMASELVTNSVVHAHTVLELRVELRGSRLQVAVHDQDPDLGGCWPAKDGTDRGLGLQIVDQVAKAWGVRQDGAGGKSVWCVLDLPAPQADTVGRSREPPAKTGTTAEAVGMDEEDRRLPDVIGSSGPDLRCGRSCGRPPLGQDFYRVPDSSCGCRPACRASSACSTRRLGSARRRCLPSGALVPPPAGWPGCRWTIATTTDPLLDVCGRGVPDRRARRGRDRAPGPAARERGPVPGRAAVAAQRPAHHRLAARAGTG